MIEIFGMIGSKNMGEYNDMQRAIRYYEEHKQDYEEKLIEVKQLMEIPFIWVKRSKYTRSYYLFNKLPIYSVESFGGV